MIESSLVFSLLAQGLRGWVPPPVRRSGDNHANNIAQEGASLLTDDTARVQVDPRPAPKQIAARGRLYVGACWLLSCGPLARVAL